MGYGRQLQPIRDVYLSRADTLIWLHLPWRVSFWRLLQRTVSRAWIGESLYENSPARESWRRIAELPTSIAVHELRSARAVAAFLESAEHAKVPHSEAS